MAIKYLTLEQIVEELDGYHKTLCEPIDAKSIDEMKQKGLELVGYLSRSAVLVADAGKLYNDAKVKAYHTLKASSEAQKQYYSPMLAKDYVAAKCATECHAYELAERINRAITHSLEILRSVLSAEKTQLAYLNNQA